MDTKGYPKGSFFVIIADMNTKYEAALKKLAKTADGMGKGLDDEIRHAVAALNAAGFVTTASCAGHFDHGLPYPWINIGEEQFTGDLQHTPKFLENFRSDLEKVAEKHVVGDDSGLSAYVNEGSKQYVIIADSDGYKRLYVNNMEDAVVADTKRRNALMAQKMCNLLEDYYTSNPTPFPFILSIQDFPESTFRLQHSISSIMPSMAISKQQRLRKECLAHMNAFADYILSK